jgi:hypothetical protein
LFASSPAADMRVAIARASCENKAIALGPPVGRPSLSVYAREKEVKHAAQLLTQSSLLTVRYYDLEIFHQGRAHYTH